MDIIEDSQEDKKFKMESKPEAENQAEIEMKSLIDELPAEMLIEILKYLDIKSLIFSRLVNRKWKEVATEILKSRDDLEIKFFYDESKKKCVVGRSWKLTPRVDFMDCFKKSKNFPYTRFSVYVDKLSVLLDHGDWIKFISDFGENIKCLKLLSGLTLGKDLIKFAEKLKCLLVFQLPNLEEFGLDFYSHENSMSSSIQLFPTGVQAVPIRLPHLKILHIDYGLLSKFRGIFTDLLKASTNLQKIELFEKIESFEKFENGFRDSENFELLHSLGKLDCLQTAHIVLDKWFLYKVKETPAIPLGFKLNQLSLRVVSLHYQSNSWSHADIFISNLFESSKDTIKNLETEPLGFLPDLAIPKFSKLNSLSVKQRVEENSTALPSGSNLTEIFPVLQFLALEHPWSQLFPHDQVFTCIPNLKNLQIVDGQITQKDIARISEICPNLKKFEICPYFFGWSITNFPEVGTAIWTHLKQLETLYLRIYVDNSTNAFPAVDSCFTGFSEKDCIRLWNLIQVKELSETKESIKKELKVERKPPSILDLKDLRKLRVRLVSENWDNEETSESVLHRNPLALSEKYAFQLMPNLTYKIEKTCRRIF